MMHFGQPTKMLLEALLIFLIAGQMACRQPAAQSSEVAQNLAAPAAGEQAKAAPALIAAGAPTSFHRALNGNIGGKYELRMELRREGDKVFGSYFYPRPGAIRYISLDGTADQQGNVSLEESTFDFNTQATNKTGEFKGKLDSVLKDEEQLVRFAGQWTRAKDKQSLPFSAQEPVFDLGSLRLKRQTQKDESKKLRYSVETRLPQLTGDAARADKFNQTVRSFTVKQVAAFKKNASEMAADPDLAKLRTADAPPNTMEIDYTINFANSNFVSLLFSFYEFTGGAHGNTATAAFNYDLQRGRLVGLGELFKPGANYLKVISDYCVGELKKLNVSDDEWIKNGAGPKPENYDSWNITPQGLRITFDAYQAAAYAAGPQEVIVPYSLLKDLIKPDGLLAQFVK